MARKFHSERWRAASKKTRFPFTAVFLLGAMSAGAPARAAEKTAALRVFAPPGHLPGVPVPVRVELQDAEGRVIRTIWNADVEITSLTTGMSVPPGTIRLRNGLGTGLLELPAAGDAVLRFRSAYGEVEKTFTDLSGEPRSEVSGDLPPGTVEWSGVVEVTSDARVPPGTTLRILPGTWLLFSGVPSGENGADLNVEGRIESLGTPEAPVVFTASNPLRPWGEVDHDGAEPSLYRWTFFTRAGHSPRGGHTNTGPAVRARGGSRIEFDHCALTDNAGKVMQTSGADLVFRNCVLARSAMGPEIQSTQLLATDTWFTEMFGEINNAGNDGDAIYIHSQSGGQQVRLENAVVAETTDDGIDTLGADVTIEGAIIRDMTCDKGISVFGGEVIVRRAVIAGNDKGLSAKSTNGSQVIIEHVTFAANRWSIESRRKSNAQSPENRFTIRNSIIRHNAAPDGSEGCESNEPVGGRSIRTDFDPSYFTIEYCDLQRGFQIEGTYHEEWPLPAPGSIYADPLFADPEAHDYHLRPDSPCIDAGDPASPPDPDGTRADMGAYPYSGTAPPLPRFLRGDVNGDGVQDVSDAVRLLLVLFGGRAAGCPDAADTDDDGAVTLTDAVRLLGALFLQGAPPAPPWTACGADPTEDALDCGDSSCP